MNEMLKKLLEGNVYDYSKLPIDNQVDGAALAPSNTTPSMVMPIPQNELPRPPLKLDFSPTPEMIEGNIAQPSNIKPELPFAYKGKPLPKEFTDAPAEPTDTPKAATLQDLLAQVKNNRPEIDPSLIAGQKDRNEMLNQALWLDAGNTFGHSMAGGTTVDKELLSKFRDVANNKVSDVIQQRGAKKEDATEDRADRNQVITETKAGYDIEKARMQVDDETAQSKPDSAISQGIREYIRKLGVNIGDTVPYSQISKMVPEFTSKYQTDLNRQAHLEGIALKRELSGDDKVDKQTQKDFDGYSKAVDYRNRSSRTAGGKIMTALDISDRLSGLIGKDPSKMTSQEMRELVTGVNSLIGGSTAVNQIEHMDYATLARTYSEFATKISGKPQPMNSPEIVQRLQTLINREHGILQKQLADDMKIQRKRFPGVKDDVRVQDLEDEIMGTRSSESHEQKSSGTFPMTIRKEGKTATVSNASELADATSKGWTP